MGRLLLIILVIVAIVLLWKAFKPSTWKRNAEINQGQAPRAVKGPDDDEESNGSVEETRRAAFQYVPHQGSRQKTCRADDQVGDA